MRSRSLDSATPASVSAGAARAYHVKPGTRVVHEGREFTSKGVFPPYSKVELVADDGQSIEVDMLAYVTVATPAPPVSSEERERTFARELGDYLDQVRHLPTRRQVDAALEAAVDQLAAFAAGTWQAEAGGAR